LQAPLPSLVCAFGWRLHREIQTETLPIAGVILLVLGLIWPWIGKLSFGRLPGDIVIERENFTLYLPIMTLLILSLLLSALLWFFGR
jgi:hypothetical protein